MSFRNFKQVAADSIRPELPDMAIDTSCVHGGDMSQVKEIVELMEQPMANINPILLAVKLKVAQDALDKWRRNLGFIADAEFSRLKKDYPDAKAWNIMDLADISAYVPAGTWAWPDTVKKLEEALESGKTKAKADKTATYTAGKIGQGTLSFKISVREP